MGGSRSAKESTFCEGVGTTWPALSKVGGFRSINLSLFAPSCVLFLCCFLLPVVGLASALLPLPCLALPPLAWYTGGSRLEKGSRCAGGTWGGLRSRYLSSLAPSFCLASSSAATFALRACSIVAAALSIAAVRVFSYCFSAAASISLATSASLACCSICFACLRTACSLCSSLTRAAFALCTLVASSISSFAAAARILAASASLDTSMLAGSTCLTLMAPTSAQAAHTATAA
mmetsp:Transcript_44281/g.110886  ORF Transcript_44281/g.110886 Transcript_44281/m.110886 type:complete len:233 (+) Transcript_44281:992-1690(+)